MLGKKPETNGGSGDSLIASAVNVSSNASTGQAGAITTVANNQCDNNVFATTNGDQNGDSNTTFITNFSKTKTSGLKEWRTTNGLIVMKE